MADVVASPRERNRALWSSGDWDQVADYIAVAGPDLLDRIGDVGPGVRLLDIGTGSGGSVAIPAASRGAEVVGADVTDSWFPAARRRAEEAGVEVEWVVGDAVQLPFEDASFDVVTSTFGHMFAPDQPAAAAELVRVCKPGGTIGLCCWTPQGATGQMFMSIASLLPPPPEGFRPPVFWGSEPHVTELLEPLGVTLDMQRTTLTIEAESLEAQTEVYEQHFGPLVTAKAAIGEEAWPAAREKFMTFLAGINENDDGSMSSKWEYLVTIGRPAADG
jgi:SAM-dependent methyltransferase